MNTQPNFWVKSKWSAQDLHEHSVEIDIKFPFRDGVLHSAGIVKFRVRQRLSGELAIDAVGYSRVERTECVQSCHQLPQALVDAIERHPDSTVAEYRLFYSA